MKYNILIISSTFFPTIAPRSFRATELATELARQGHVVKVITSYENNVNYDDLGNKYGIQFKDLGREKLKTFKLNGNKVVVLIKRLINRSLLMLFEFPDIQIMPMVIRALRNEHNYDLLISIAVPYPIHWGVAWSRTSKRRLARTWVADCGDPYMGDRIDTFRKLFYFGYVEKWFCCKADYLTIPTKAAVEGYYKEFHHKIRVIPQGFSFDNLQFKSKIFNHPVTFAYAGNLIPVNRDPRPFLEYLCGLDMDFKFYIFTKKIELIEKYKQKLHAKLEVKDYIPRNQLIKLLSDMDFLVNFDNNTNIHTPSKLIDYAISGRPVLNIKAELDISVINAFLNRDYSGAYQINNLDQYNIVVVTGKFLELIN
jgi:hypothetical protein